MYACIYCQTEKKEEEKKTMEKSFKKQIRLKFDVKYM